jgi:soluble lytic murein transglycosylase-like protein
MNVRNAWNLSGMTLIALGLVAGQAAAGGPSDQRYAMAKPAASDTGSERDKSATAKMAALSDSDADATPTPADKPVDLHALVAAKAKAHGVPLALARAVVKVESNFRPRTTGRAGEIGLMQIKYNTARMLGYSGSRQGLYDPATNLEWGMRYLAGAYKLGGDDICRTALKYQGGHAATRVSALSRTYCAKVRRVMASN